MRSDRETGEEAAGETPDPPPGGEDASNGLNDDVLEMVRRQLDRDPPPATTALYGRAASIDSDIYQLSLRQFHAKYPLRVKRERARAARDGASGRDADGRSGGGAGPAAAGGGEADEEAVPEEAGRHLSGDDEAAGARPGRRPATEAADDGGRRRGRAAGRRPDAETRERLRRVFWRFARDVSEAETADELVRLVQRMPERVDEIARVLSRRGRGD